MHLYAEVTLMINMCNLKLQVLPYCYVWSMLGSLKVVLLLWSELKGAVIKKNNKEKLRKINASCKYLCLTFIKYMINVIIDNIDDTILD